MNILTKKDSIAYSWLYKQTNFASQKNSMIKSNVMYAVPYGLNSNPLLWPNYHVKPNGESKALSM
jgi:hypothetical protein